MNKFRLLAIALVFGTASLFANNITSPDVSKEEIREQIIELVENSEITFESQGTINIFFTFSSEGEIIVTKVDSRDKNVLSFIRKNINGKTLKNPGIEGKKIKMSLLIK